MKLIYIFAYGSLFNLESASKTLQRELKITDYKVVEVSGFHRVWNYKSKVYSYSLNREIDAVYLNLESVPNEKVNGAILQVNEKELEALKKRESNYDLVDITEKVIPKTDEQVFAFICNDQKFLTKNNDDGYVMNKYVDMVDSGCKNIGSIFYKIYLSTTDSIKFKRLDGDYSFIH